MQPARVQDDLNALGWLEGRRRVALSAHHKLREGVAAVAFGVLLKQCQRFILHLRPAVALDELHLELALLVLEDECLHGGAGVVVCLLGNLGRPDPGLLVQVRWHEQRDLVVTQADLDHLLQARVKPHEAATLRHGEAVNLQLELVEATVALGVHLLLKVDAISTVHFVQDLLDGCPHLCRVRGIIQVRSPLATAAVDAFDQTLFVGVHGCDGLHEVLHACLLCLCVIEINLQILLGEDDEGRRGGTHVLADSLEAYLLELLACNRLGAGPDEAQRIHGTRCLGGLGEGGPAWHEANLLVLALGGKGVVLSAQPVEALREMLHVTPGLGPHVERAVHARQSLIALLDGLDDTDVVAPDSPDVCQHRLRCMLRLIVGDHRWERRRRKWCRDVGAAVAGSLHGQRPPCMGESAGWCPPHWQLRGRRLCTACQL
mmetsp:Transcript_19638/g.53407  ORF Transcript_19638/g.53407 Transcript_19638/m.53407 type:complete len:431 (+) Transcript_19638:1335-2627(+)